MPAFCHADPSSFCPAACMTYKLVEDHIGRIHPALLASAKQLYDLVKHHSNLMEW
jgi:hypothetical protein